MNKLEYSKVITEKFKIVITTFIFALGTLISGTTFLLSAQIIVGLPISLGILFATVVIPTIIVNSIAGVILYKIVLSSLRKIAIS